MMNGMVVQFINVDIITTIQSIQLGIRMVNALGVGIIIMLIVFHYHNRLVKVLCLHLRVCRIML